MVKKASKPSGSAALEMLDELARAEEECRTAEANVNLAKSQLKDDREAYDKAVFTLRQLASGALNDQDRGLINDQED